MDNELLDIITLYLQKDLKESKKDQNKDGKNDFKDIQIARRKASGKSIEDIKKDEPDLFELSELINTIIQNKSNLQEKSKKKKKTDFHKGGQDTYRSGRSSKQLSKQISLTRAYAAADTEEEKQKIRDRIDKSRAKEKPVKESLTRLQIRRLLNEVFIDIINEKKKKKKKKKKLSAKTMTTLRKKAKSSGYTAGSLASEYRKGLGAYYSSGSRKGMSSHQWAMARVNSAIRKGNPSWANLKKSKKKK